MKAQFATIREEVFEAVARTLESQQFILGAEVAAFESEVVGITGCSHAIACASGTDALILALRALDIGPGDEVITTPFTFVASAGSIENVGAKPVFVDIDPVTFNIDPEKLEQAITPATVAIMPVHLFGLCAEMDKVNEIAARHGLNVIEDAAQAIGAQDKNRAAGGLGLMGCFSFFPSKNLGGAGDGGLVSTNDEGCAERLKLLHVHGARDRYEYEIVGMNSRLDALQAAILRVKLRHLNDWTLARRRNAQRYRQFFGEFGLSEKVGIPQEPKGKTHVYNQFTIRLPNRDGLREKLRGKGVPSEIYYPIPLHLQTAFRHLACRSGDFPESERASVEVLSLPIYPELTEEQQRGVVAAIAESLK